MGVVWEVFHAAKCFVDDRPLHTSSDPGLDRNLLKANGVVADQKSAS